MTYADGVADVDLGALLDSIASTGRWATVTVVQPHLQWGVAEIGADDRVAGFVEKPRSEHWINGGFFCLRAGRARLPRRARACWSASRWSGSPPTAELRAHRHEGFWDCMDTYKDAVALNDLWATGDAPWPTLATRTTQAVRTPSGVPVQ